MKLLLLLHGEIGSYVPLDPVQDNAVVQWFDDRDDRIVAFVKAYVAIVRQDAALQEHLKDQFVETPSQRFASPSILLRPPSIEQLPCDTGRLKLQGDHPTRAGRLRQCI
jgi:hypothetical protein